jgi:hypothetical protein
VKSRKKPIPNPISIQKTAKHAPNSPIEKHGVVSQKQQNPISAPLMSGGILI